MDISLNTNREKQTICVKVRVDMPMPVRILLFDPEKKFAVYSDAVVPVHKKEDMFFIRLPQAPRTAILRLTVNVPNGQQYEKNLKAVVKVLPLKQNLHAFNYLDPEIVSFVNFAQVVAEDIGIMSNGVYWDDSGKYRVHIVDSIKKDGHILTTPACIGENTGRIQLAHGPMTNMTIPGRVYTQLHEFNHFYKNRRIEDEVEADLRALSIGLGLGYSRYEARKVFLSIFHSHPSQLNAVRNEKIKKFIDNFEKGATINYNYYYVGENGEK